jgi:hypothetical protein
MHTAHCPPIENTRVGGVIFSFRLFFPLGSGVSEYDCVTAVGCTPKPTSSILVL